MPQTRPNHSRMRDLGHVNARCTFVPLPRRRPDQPVPEPRQRRPDPVEDLVFFDEYTTLTEADWRRMQESALERELYESAAQVARQSPHLGGLVPIDYHALMYAFSNLFGRPEPEPDPDDPNRTIFTYPAGSFGAEFQRLGRQIQDIGRQIGESIQTGLARVADIFPPVSDGEARRIFAIDPASDLPPTTYTVRNGTIYTGSGTDQEATTHQFRYRDLMLSLNLDRPGPDPSLPDGVTTRLDPRQGSRYSVGRLTLTGDTRPVILLASGDADAGSSPGVPQMPRRRNRQACECGCGQVTETGRFMRGHATRRRWFLIKTAELAQGEAVIDPRSMSHIEPEDARTELGDRGWRMPESRRAFGVEIELILTPDAIGELRRLFKANRLKLDDRDNWNQETPPKNTWMMKTDSSVKPQGGQITKGMVGRELVSPPLRGKRGEAQVERVIRLVNIVGAAVNKTCGFHVHVMASDLSVKGIRQTVRAYSVAQNGLDAIMAPSRRYGSNEASTYCKRWETYSLDLLDSCDTVQKMAQTGGDRAKYRTVNLSAFPRIGTVEFRQHHGTLNPVKILDWVLFVRRLVQTAAKDDVAVQVQNQLDDRTTLRTVLEAVKLDQGMTLGAYNRFMLRQTAYAELGAAVAA